MMLLTNNTNLETWARTKTFEGYYIYTPAIASLRSRFFFFFLNNNFRKSIEFSILWLSFSALEVNESFWANQGFTEHYTSDFSSQQVVAGKLKLVRRITIF